MSATGGGVAPGFTTPAGGVAGPRAPASTTAPQRLVLAARVGAVLTLAGRAALVGALSGAAMGLAARIAMRVVAITSGRIGTVARPESGAVPGEVTLDGTLFLVMAGAMLGLVLTVAIVVVLGRWLPGPSASRRLLVGALAGGPPSLLLVDPANVDFVLFGPTWLAVVLFLACGVGFGAAVARWSPSPASIADPPPSSAGPRRLIVGTIGAGALAMLAAIGLGSAAGVAVTVVAVAVVALSVTARSSPRWSWWWHPVITGVGRLAVTSGAVVLVGAVVVRAVQILA